MQNLSRASLLRSLRVYAVTDDVFLEGIEEKVKGLSAAGVKSIQVRMKKGTSSELRELTNDIIKIARPAGMLVIVNDKAEICMKTNADGAHIGKDDGCLFESRSILGNKKILGSTIYGDSDLLKKSIDAGVDYVGTGSIFPTATKSANTIGLVSLPPLRTIINSSGHKPLLISIGGITSNNCIQCFNHGADGVAIVSDLLKVDPPYEDNCKKQAEIILAKVGLC